MDVIQKKLSEITPYAKNAKKHDKKQIANVAESIKQYGFVQPVVIDRNGVIVIIFDALIEFLDISGAITVCMAQGGDYIGGG